MVAPAKPHRCGKTVRIVESDNEMFRFFLTGLNLCPLVNLKGQILIFETHKQATYFGDRCPALSGGYAIIGLGIEKWEKFLEDKYSWVLLEDK